MKTNLDVFEEMIVRDSRIVAVLVKMIAVIGVPVTKRNWMMWEPMPILVSTLENYVVAARFAEEIGTEGPLVWVLNDEEKSFEVKSRKLQCLKLYVIWQSLRFASFAVEFVHVRAKNHRRNQKHQIFWVSYQLFVLLTGKRKRKVQVCYYM